MGYFSRLFKKPASKKPEKTDALVALGETGSPHDIAEALVEKDTTEMRQRILTGALNGFLSGKVENLQTFFATDFEVTDTSFHSARSRKDGYDVLIEHNAGYFLAITVSKLNIAQTVQALEKMSEPEKQEALDYALYIVTDGLSASKTIVEDLEKLVAAGADINSMHGLALYSAAKQNNEPLVKKMNDWGADFQLAFKLAQMGLPTAFAEPKPDKEAVKNLDQYRALFNQPPK